MSRRRVPAKREVLPDARYGSTVITKFINRMMYDGKRTVSSGIIYEALEAVKAKVEVPVLEVFTKAVENVKPVVEVKSRRVGGATYQVPIEVRDSRREALAMRWLITAARSRSGKSMAQKLAMEFLDAFNSTGTAFKKKEDTHRMAEANKAFAHYRW
jgi:small subunit ribosomal protein S7